MHCSLFDGVSHPIAAAGIGSALVDICLLESEAFLLSSGAEKGGMKLVGSSFIPEVLQRSQKKPSIVPGGSACNTILGLGKLGASTRFVGKRGEDEWGTLFESGVRGHNVDPMLFTSPTPTGHVLSIITPDAQRSMLTYLGASAETSPSEITPALFEGMALVHLEGYLLFNKELMMASLDAARASGAKISLDLASFTVVEAAHPYLRPVIEEYVDIVIANEDEARAYTGYSDEERALSVLAGHAEVAVVKIGKRGSLVACGGETIRVEAICDGSAVDTTGAGDLWASGFLFGLLNGFTVEASGRLGSACGYEVCRNIGAVIPEEGWQRIRALRRTDSGTGAAS